MNKYAPAVLLPLFIACSGDTFSDTCYTVEGDVRTTNVPGGNQVGVIELQLFDEADDERFRQTGTLSGTITGASGIGQTLLSHSATFEDGSTFVTDGDTAQITAIRRLDGDGLPCAFDVHEVISDLAGGPGFFANTNSVHISADGYVDACLSEGDNENEFVLTGTLCVD